MLPWLGNPERDSTLGKKAVIILTRQLKEGGEVGRNSYCSRKCSLKPNATMHFNPRAHVTPWYMCVHASKGG